MCERRCVAVFWGAFVNIGTVDILDRLFVVCGGAGLCLVGHLKASVPLAPISAGHNDHQNISKHFHMSSGGQNCSWLTANVQSSQGC